MDILTLVAVFGMAIIVGVLVFFAYRQGLIDGQRVKEEKPIKEVSIPKVNKTAIAPDEIIDGYNNIMAYDGKDKK